MQEKELEKLLKMFKGIPSSEEAVRLAQTQYDLSNANNPREVIRAKEKLRKAKITLEYSNAASLEKENK